MLLPVYYIIRPNDAFLERLQTADPEDDWACLLTDAEIWCRHEFTTANVAIPIDTWIEQRAAQVKMMFMLNLVGEYAPDGVATNALTDFLFAVIQWPALTSEVLDRWWTLERHESAMDFKQQAERLPTKVLEAIVPPENALLVEWIGDLKKAAEE